MNQTSIGGALATAITLALTLTLGGCGGGGAESQPDSACSLQNQGACGGSGTVTPPVVTPVIPVTPVTPVTPLDPATLASSVSLLLEAPTIASAGGSTGLTALVTDAANKALAGAAVSFSADSGVIEGVDSVTDKNGRARAVLGAGASSSNRAIRVVVTVGSKSASASVDVGGTTLAISGPATLNSGQSADVGVTLRDSAGKPLAGAAIVYASASGNTLTAKSGATTNAQGQLVFSVLAARAGIDSISVTAQGASATLALTVAAAAPANGLSLLPAVGLDASGAEVIKEVATGACQPVDLRYDKAGATATLSTSRGRLYSDDACAVPLSAALAMIDGVFPRSYIQSANTGIATLVATLGAGGVTAQTRLEFIAPLTANARLSLQAELPIIASAERSVLRAVVRDGSAANNLVKGATVRFSILNDASGGVLLQPASVASGSDGVAQATYVAGAADSGNNGVLIQASIGGAPATAEVRLTVAKKALSIQFGTGNKVTEYSASLLQKEFAVLVSDAAGNAVPGVTVSASAWSLQYAKGHYNWAPDKVDAPDVGSWLMTLPIYYCANEDLLRNGIYDAAFDINGNGVLDPGIPLTVSNGAKTDALGLSSVTLNYPRSYGSWVQVELTVRGNVAGTEAASSARLWLPTVAQDFSSRKLIPPGQVSPYGEGACNAALRQNN